MSGKTASCDVVLDGFDEIPTDDADTLVEADEAYYEDNFCKLTPRKLELKAYFFPLGKLKTMSLNSITSLYHRKQEGNKDLVSTKGWGMCGTRTWWARDVKRGFRSNSNANTHVDNHHNAVVDIGERLLKGFTVRNFDDFMEKLRRLRPTGITVVNELPDLF